MATAQDLMTLFGVTIAQAQRAATAFGKYWHLTDQNDNPRDATADEIISFLRRQVNAVVKNIERGEQEAQIIINDWK